ncbi:MAG: LamG domain-containing protein [Kiritimatiellae bacterium]|nr:LamG domain-containing protein [Kiritimatiellia bacterium]
MKTFLLFLAVAIPLLPITDALSAETPTWSGYWPFNGHLSDVSGNGQHAYADQSVFTPGVEGQALRLTPNTVIDIPDAPGLRLTHGFRLACRVRLATLPVGNAWATIAIKGEYSKGEYVLRVDPASEGRHLSFFVNTGDWEPRVKSKTPIKPGTWYQVEAGWDEQGLWMTANNETTRTARSGDPIATRAPLRLGSFDGELDELRIASPGGNHTAVACWPFDGNTRDASGHGHDFSGAKHTFVPVTGGEALHLTSTDTLAIPSTPELQLAPGIRIDCSLFLKETSKNTTPIIIKDNEYQLRVNPQSEDGKLAFFVNLGGWEPRVSAGERIKPNTWYRIIAQWDGLTMSLEVNGRQSKTHRSGFAKPGNSSLVLGGFSGLLDNVRIDNPKPDLVRLRNLSAENTLLRAGRSERLTGMAHNFGNVVTGCVVTLELPKGVVYESPAMLNIGALPAGSTKPVEWRVRAEASISATATFKIVTPGAAPILKHKSLAFLAQTDPGQSARARDPLATRDAQAVTYYVDSLHGNNALSGTTPESAWKDFTLVNGRTLGPGEQLLIRRGSVINQELQLSARGTAQAWAEIGAYGEGPRPIIRRNWHINDRCMLITAPDYLCIRGLVVSHAGKGVIAYYPKRGHRGLLIEDCIAHHIEGLYRHNSHGIPEWLDQRGAPGDGMNSSVGFGVSGASAEDLVLRNCEMFQCSWGFRFSGDNVTIDRIFCHDNYAHNTSPHPAITSIQRSYLQNSIFDASGWHAFAGTMGIMVCYPQSLIIRNCHFLNQPDSGSHDQGGIDFEAGGEGCLIDCCTFRNNAGAAIEVLGLRSPQARKIEVVGSRFDRNNIADKLGPSEIFIWGGSSDPEICCSTGLIRDNGCVLTPGVAFFTNQAPATTHWVLSNNTEYATAEDMDKAMPLNNPPTVEAGEEIWSDQAFVRLAGAVSDDKKPAPGKLAIKWEVMEGPGNVTFHNADNPITKADFSAPGDYGLRLTADDGELWRCSHTAIHILPANTAVARAWSFSTPLNKEGWSDKNLGTKDMEFKGEQWSCISRPVQLVAGGHYIVAMESAPDAHLLSPDALNVDIDKNKIIAIRLQNHTPVEQMRIRFTTKKAPTWDANLSQAFAVTPHNTVEHLYTIDMRKAPGWSGKLKQLRIDFTDGTPLTGTCRIDYIWIGQQPKK